MDHAITKSEQTQFGKFLEAVAVDVATHLHGGQKSSSRGMDLDFTRKGTRYIVSIKSSPNWGNSGQQESLKKHFKRREKNFGAGRGQDPHPMRLGMLLRANGGE